MFLIAIVVSRFGRSHVEQLRSYLARWSRRRRAKRLRSCPPDTGALRAPVSSSLTSLRRSARHHLDDPRRRAMGLRHSGI